MLAVASGDHLIEKVRGLLVERKIPQLIADEQRGLGIASQLAYQGVIDLRGQQVIEHVHGGSEESSDIGLAGSPAEDLRQVGLAGPRITDEHHIGAFLQEVQVEKPEDAGFALQPGFVVLEVKGIDGGLSMEAGEVEAAFHGAMVAGLQFEIDQALQGRGETKVSGGRILQGRLQVLAQSRELQLFEFLLQGSHRSPFEPPG